MPAAVVDGAAARRVRIGHRSPQVRSAGAAPVVSDRRENGATRCGYLGLRRGHLRGGSRMHEKNILRTRKNISRMRQNISRVGKNISRVGRNISCKGKKISCMRENIL